MKRTALLLPFAILLAVMPPVVLADVPAGTWTITGLELNGTHIDAKGSIGFSGTGFGATVGCNSIGGQASVDENGVLTFTGDLTTTLIGCPKDVAMAEDALMKILSGGPIKLGDSQWSNAVGDIDVVPNDVADPGCIPPVAPGANPGNVTVPCGNGGGGVDPGGNGSTIETTQPATATDPTMLLGLGAITLLVIATVATFIYLGPRRTPGGGSEG